MWLDLRCGGCGWEFCHECRARGIPVRFRDARPGHSRLPKFVLPYLIKRDKGRCQIPECRFP